MTENEKLQKAIEEEKELYEIMKDRYEKLGVESCKDRAEEHGLNIKWLKEIQQYRAIGTIEEFKALKVTQKMIEKSNFCLEQYRADTDTAYQCGYNKAIDEFANTLIPRLTDAIYQKDVESMINLINDVARELKAGGENEID